MTPIAALALVTVVACSSEDPGVCSSVGDPEVRVFQRGDSEEIVDGSIIPVFPPPQGGVFTELDVRFYGVSTDDLQSVRVDILDAGGSLLAAQLYNGEGLPLSCKPEGFILVEDMPVGFNASVVLDQLDGVAVTMTTRLRYPGGTVEAKQSATLSVTDY